MPNLSDFYHYNEIKMMYINPEDHKYLARSQANFTPAMATVHPTAKRTRLRVAALKTCCFPEEASGATSDVGSDPRRGGSA
jgi:hypothetical protein